MSRRYKVTMPANDKLNAFQEGVLFKNGRAIVDESTINKNLKLSVDQVVKNLEAVGFVCELVYNADGTVYDSEEEAKKEKAEAEAKAERNTLMVENQTRARELAADPKARAKAEAKAKADAEAEEKAQAKADKK